MNFFTELKEGLLVAWSAIRANRPFERILANPAPRHTVKP
jgi:hypothetical protein